MAIQFTTCISFDGSNGANRRADANVERLSQKRGTQTDYSTDLAQTRISRPAVLAPVASLPGDTLNV